MISLGPLPIMAILALVCCGIALGLVKWRLRRQAPPVPRRGADVAFWMLLWLLLAARAGFVLTRMDSYASDPFSLLRFSDGGFSLPWGIAAALLYGGWATRSQRRLRAPLLVSMSAALALWWAGGWAISAAQREAIVLPAVALQTLDGRPTTLAAHRGKPIVLNLWATWCPPCRREMPVLARAQASQSHAQILLVNQGEDQATISHYLQTQGLQVRDVYLDPGMHSMKAAGTQGLPITLFFDANGRLVDAHMGEITAPVLQDKLSLLD